MHDGGVRPPAAAHVDLVVPVKGLRAAKSRLRGAADAGAGDPAAHARLALALVLDTLSAARLARVRTLLVVTADAAIETAVGQTFRPGRVASVTRTTGDDDDIATPGRAVVEVVAEGGLPGLNAALTHGADLLRARDPDGIVGALQSDLPALRPAELDAALAAAAAAFAAGAERAFCSDAPGDGTSLLLAAPGVALDPMFGTGSAARHAESGAVPLGGALPGLRRDVDTPDDLREAVALGLGARTAAALPVTARGA